MPLATSYIYGVSRLSDGTAALNSGVKVRIVQPSVPQRDKWRPEKQAEIFRDHLDLSRRDPAGRVDNLAGIALLVWPEAAMPFLPLATPEALAAIADLVPEGTHLVTGALRIEEQAAVIDGGRRRRDAYNALMAFDADGRLAALYDKIHLVPFGEYLPFQAFLERIGLQQLTRMRGGFTAGRSPRPLLSLTGVPVFGGLICYEAIFPGRVYPRGERPDWIATVTNDGWFGDSSGPRQHLDQARLRTIETGLPMARSANTGVSALFDGAGRMIGRVPLYETGVIDRPLPKPLPATVYQRVGDAVFWVMMAAVFAFGALTPKRLQKL